ncbi:MAG: GMC family oxidoreductase N-terminal domain-containing protein, partial [Rhizobium sp.]
MSDSGRFDFIIVGGGSSACVVAARLVTEGRARVLLIERGPAKASPIMHFPAGYMKFLAKDTYLAMHKTKPQPQLDGRGPIVPQGKVLGGGSTVNAMVYMRGQAADFDRWNELISPPGANDGAWSYRDMLPYFKAQEDNDHLAGEFHGVGGPLKVSHLGHTSPMTRTYVKTLQGMGIPYNPDFNGARQFGVGFMQHTIDWRTHRRSSAVDAFLAPVMNDPLLTIETDATVTGLKMDGDRVTGVDYLKNGRSCSASAGIDVILAAGAYQTPKLMMVSGIGPEEELGKHGIRTKV